MSETEYNVNLRDLHFVLFEQLAAEKLCELPPFRDFSGDDFKMIVDEGARFAKEVVAPANRPGDTVGCQFDKGTVTVPEAVKQAWHAYREAGWICMNGHQEHGGQGLPTTVSIAVGELFTGACCAMSLCALLSQGVIHILEKFAKPEEKALYLPKLFAGDWTGTMVLTEPQAGSDVGANRAKAVKAGDGPHCLISGDKIFITFGDHDMAENVIHLVLARVAGAPGGTKGLSLFIVPKYRLEADGSLGAFNDVRCAGIEHKLGINASATSQMSFGQDGDCHGYILGEEGDGIRIMFNMMNEARVDCGVQGSAQASAAYLNALSYAQQRVQGVSVAAGRDPEAPKVTIDQHPDVRRMLLHMRAYVEAMRSLLVSTARYIDISVYAGSEEERATALGFLELLTPICKGHCSDMGFDVCHNAVQVYGGYGYLRDYPVEQYLRDVRIASIYEGTNGIQAMDLMGRKIPMKGGAIFKAYLAEMTDFAQGLAGDPALGGAASRLIEAVGALGKVAGFLGGLVRQDVEQAFLHATPLLRIMGDIVLAYHALWQASIASEKVEPGLDRAAIAKSPEATFYTGKLHNALYFADSVLPSRIAEAESLAKAGRAPLDAVFPEMGA